MNRAFYSQNTTEPNNKSKHPYPRDIDEYKRSEVKKYYPTSLSVNFWEKHFSNFDEVTIEHFISFMIPQLEYEVKANFYYDQIMNLISMADYECNFVISKYEAFFF